MTNWNEVHIYLFFFLFISLLKYSLCIDCYSPLGQFAGQILPSSYSCLGASFYLPNTDNICCSYETVPAPTNIKNITKYEFFKSIFENSGDEKRTEYLYAWTDAALQLVLSYTERAEWCRVKSGFLAILAAETNGYQTFDSNTFTYPYKPRGILRSTNQTSYHTLYQITMFDYSKLPEKLVFISDAISSTGRFWNKHRDLAGQLSFGFLSSFQWVTETINNMNGMGSTVSWEEKKRRFELATKVLKCI